jgi:hypothetical protein
MVTVRMRTRTRLEPRAATNTRLDRMADGGVRCGGYWRYCVDRRSRLLCHAEHAAVGTARVCLRPDMVSALRVHGDRGVARLAHR